MKSLIDEARTCHGEHTTHGKFIQALADYAEAAKRDASLVELNRKLAITAIEHSELYQAAKRDAEEAEAYAAELEAKLAKAVGALEEIADPISLALGNVNAEIARTTLAELKGGSDEG